MQDPDAIYNPFTISELMNHAPSLPWLQYFFVRFPFNEYPDLINETTSVIVETPSFFSGVSRFLDEEESDVLDYYFAW